MKKFNKSQVPLLQDSEMAKCSSAPGFRNGKCSSAPGFLNGKCSERQEKCSSAPGFQNGKMSPSRVSLESENDSSRILDFDQFLESD
ncbi:unnamed protein product [Rhizophagus irregularis]|nr:unnamed protein product [Rhizophagus irregularis]